MVHKGQCAAVRPRWWQPSRRGNYGSLLSRCFWLSRLLQMHSMRSTPQMRTLQNKYINSRLYSPLMEAQHLLQAEIEAHQPRQPHHHQQQCTVSLKDTLLAKWHTVSQAVVLPHPYGRAGPCCRGPRLPQDSGSPHLFKMNVGNRSFSRAYGGCRGFLLPAAHHSWHTPAAQGLHAPSSTRGISSCRWLRHNSTGVTEKSSTWAKPRYAEFSERKRKLITSPWMQREMALLDW